ncbi:MAG: 3,4-dehydroadipyl-CoA semialdehyde dehydrogenase, partial [Myxococcota bacterium]
MLRLQSYLQDKWVSGAGTPRQLVNPATEAVIAETTTKGLDYAAALAYARDVGGPALRSMTFAERGALLKAMSRALYEKREELLSLSTACNGATRGDSKFDVDGAMGTLSAYARIGAELGDGRHLIDGEADRLSSGARYVGQHVRVPRPGVAVQINAFNFPAWGTFEKIAPAFLAGVPVLTKPATATAPLTYRMIQIIVAADILPPGALSFVAGSAGDLLDHLGPQDLIAFTGSADTAAVLRSGAGVRERSVRMNVEADSLNAAVLAPDVAPNDPVWHAFVRAVMTDMRQKTGQKCTAIRRVFIPRDRVDDVVESLKAEMAQIVVGDPSLKEVTMGPVATASQLRDCREGIAFLAEQADILAGGADPVAGVGVDGGKGYFVAPTLLLARDAASADRVHHREVFGPVVTLLPYDGQAETASALVALG